MRQRLVFTGVLVSFTALAAPASAQGWFGWDGPGFSIGFGSGPYYGSYYSAPVYGSYYEPSYRYSRTYVEEPTYGYSNRPYGYEPAYSYRSYSTEPTYNYSYQYEPGYTYRSRAYSYDVDPFYRDGSRVSVGAEFRGGDRSRMTVRYGRGENSRGFRNETRNREFVRIGEGRRSAYVSGEYRGNTRSVSRTAAHFSGNETVGVGVRSGLRTQGSTDVRSRGTDMGGHAGRGPQRSSIETR